MAPAVTRVYSVCRRCARPYPEGRRCPSCDGDREAARAIAVAIADSVEASPRVPAVRRRRRGTLLVTSVLAASFIAGLAVMMISILSSL